MLINLRNALMAGKKWKNPYQPADNSLAMMFDAEWNAGGGGHDAGSTTWIDIVGDKTIALPSATQVLDKKITFTQDAISSAISYDSDIPAYSVFHTFRMLNQDQASQRIFQLLSQGTSGSVGSYSWNGSIPLRAFRGVNWRNITLEDYDAPCQIGIVYSTKKDSSSSDAIFAIYVNGVQVYKLVGPSWYFGYDFTLSGNYFIGAATNRPQDVYNIRLYSREVTATEVAEYYAIDKARFGLP